MLPYPSNGPAQPPPRPGRPRLPAKITVIASIAGLLFALAAWGMGSAFVSGENQLRGLARELQSGGLSATVEDARLRSIRKSDGASSPALLELTFKDVQGRVQKGTTYFSPVTVGSAPTADWVDEFVGKESIVGAELRYLPSDPAQLMLVSEIGEMSESPVSPIAPVGWVFRGLSLVAALACIIALVRAANSRRRGANRT